MQSNSISIFDYSFSTGDLVLAAAVLLLLAALLLVFSSRRKVALQNSEVTEEMMIYLARIADALEVQAARTPERFAAEVTAALRQPAIPPVRTPIATDPDSVPFPRFNGETPPAR